MRFTKIVSTIGPATNTPEKIEELAKLGINVCRLNFSHGDYVAHGKVIDAVRVVQKKGYTLGIMLDTKGPEVRTGDVKEPIMIKAGDKVLFMSHPTGKETMKTVKVDYDGFAHDVKQASCIIVDNGGIEFKVESINKDGSVLAKALEDGKIGSRRHVNLPGAHISLPSFTPKDWADIKFGVEKGVDYIATSFVRTGEDIEELKAFLKKNKSSAEIYAKIETPQAVDNIDAIIEASDGIMVARGDLGSEIPFEDVPAVQDEIVYKCRASMKPVIIATHMLESMITSPTPTRAEVSDIAYAAKQQADSTMLSGETAGGMYPFKSVAAMARVIKANEIYGGSDCCADECMTLPADHKDAPRREQALAACVLAEKLEADAIIAISKTGRTAKAVSNCRPMTPIYAFTPSDDVSNKLTVVWGVEPMTIKFAESPDKNIDSAIALAVKMKHLKKGQRVVVVSDIKTTGGQIMSIQIRTIA